MPSAKLFLYTLITFNFILLNKHAASQTLICAVGDQEDKVTRITCPSGSIISDVNFASYGNPEGSCGSYTVGPCHAPNSMNIVSNECLNQTTCSMTPSHGVFDLSECHDEAMQLYAEVLCSEYSISPTVHPLGEEVTVNVIEEMGTDDDHDDTCTYYYSKCYYFDIGSSYSWSECKSKCASLGASMLCITDSTTNSWIANKINTIITNNDYSYYQIWIGYSDSSSTGYEWVTGCYSSYTNWDNYDFYSRYDYVYMNPSSGNWYASRGYTSSYTACACQQYTSSNDDDSSSSSTVSNVITIILTIFAAVFIIGCCVVCGERVVLCGQRVLSTRNVNRIVSVDSSYIDTSNDQDYANGNIVHTFQVTNSSQEYGHGNISPSFPVASGNKGFHVIGNNQGIPVTSINEGIPVISSNNQVYGNVTTF